MLATLGWYLHAIVPEEQLNEKINEYGNVISWVTVSIFIAAVIIYLIVKYIRKKKQATV